MRALTLYIHGGQVLGLEVNHALLIAYAVRLIQVLGRLVEAIRLSWGHGVHNLYFSLL